MTTGMQVEREMVPPIAHVYRALMLLCVALALPRGAEADILGVAETLGCELRALGPGAGDQTPELLASLVDYGCYCNVGGLAGTSRPLAPSAPSGTYVRTRRRGR